MPGLLRLSHRPADGWGVTLSTVNGSVSCQSKRNAPFECSAFPGLESVGDHRSDFTTGRRGRRNVELPEPRGSSDFEYLELKNNSKALLALSGVVISSPNSAQMTISDEPECVVNAGETLLVSSASQNESAPGATCRVVSSGSLDERTIEVTGPRRIDFPQRDWLETADEPRRSWQVDARGKACLLPSSPGRPNSRCP